MCLFANIYNIAGKQSVKIVLQGLTDQGSNSSCAVILRQGFGITMHYVYIGAQNKMAYKRLLNSEVLKKDKVMSSIYDITEL